ncbi:PREDICTED: probable glycosyltransferase At5g03795 isoform X2 [Nelumbo nucifera]|uniref:Probable glycosyltransferase At5g03795 isoform X2 n=1 Tax=Nelumbo nucifera TaxID=4432 RepID=A0A1U8AAZ2_NELNU|nr:PREDICTED: probable glycosyltransferase At5g03795 isoform X2 [Nelumbo nucifera]
MKELRRWCRGYRIQWRKLFFVVAFITTAGAVLQTCTLPYPLTMWFFFPPVTVSSYKASVAMMQVNDTSPLARPEKFSLVPFSPAVSLNSTVGLIQIPPVVEDDKKIPPRGNYERIRTNIRKETSDEPKRYLWSSPPDEALLYAKKEIEHAPVVADDPDLYAPLFRNVSIFKRSYELMESILKVYTYKDGARPIFHQPYLRGIYASEGWFMKLMEENRQFVTRDPSKAHLFYLPYSARQLEIALYVPNSHNMRTLSIFLRDYVNMIAAKYPFWNRTRGSDHFLVACHDWGPYTVNEHEELSKNTIKALCNADLSEGVFVAGKDVSLPETTIRNPRRPLRGLGGKRVSQRSILAFFAGNMHGRVRPILLKYWGDKDEDMKIYGPLPNRVSRKMSYVQHMKSSRFCICPMGYEVNSPRIVEAIYYECVPVIIADNFVPPFNEVLDWNAFSVIVAEKDIPSLKDILLAIPMRRYLSMQKNVKMLQKHFLWNPRPIRYDLFHMILHSLWFNRLNQIQIP